MKEENFEGANSFRVKIDGRDYSIYPDRENGENEEQKEVSDLVMGSLRSVRAEIAREQRSIFFDQFGRRRKKPESARVRKNKTVLLSALEGHVDILQGRKDGNINFIKGSDGKIVGLTISTTPPPEGKSVSVQTVRRFSPARYRNEE